MYNAYGGGIVRVNPSTKYVLLQRVPSKTRITVTTCLAKVAVVLSIVRK